MRTKALKQLEAKSKRPCRFIRCDNGSWCVARPSWLFVDRMVYESLGFYPSLAAAINAAAQTQE